MSDRASPADLSLPGDMYATNHESWPVNVSVEQIALAGISILATPKSSSLTAPLAVSRMLPGLRSHGRCPFSRSLRASASGRWLTASSGGRGFQWLPDKLHHR
jgi:hypothetical protein